MNNKYVYSLTANGEPFYIGKGTHVPGYTHDFKYRRMHDHLNEAKRPTEFQHNKIKCSFINKFDVDFNIIMDNISEQEAIDLENRLIEHHGRIFDGGTLTNIVTNNNIAKSTRRKPVFCFTVGGEFIKGYASIREAATCTGVTSSTIVMCCKGQYKTAGGYVWSYINTFPGFSEYVAWNAREIDCYSKDGTLLGTYNNSLEAERHTNVRASDINKCCRGENFTAGGYVWCVHGESFKNPTPRKAGRKQRRVVQFDMNDNIIKIYDSQQEAITSTGLTGIGQCCTGRNKTAGNFQWKYEDEL